MKRSITGRLLRWAFPETAKKATRAKRRVSRAKDELLGRSIYRPVPDHMWVRQLKNTYGDFYISNEPPRAPRQPKDKRPPPDDPLPF